MYRCPAFTEKNVKHGEAEAGSAVCPADTVVRKTTKEQLCLTVSTEYWPRMLEEDRKEQNLLFFRFYVARPEELINFPMFYF